MVTRLLAFIFAVVMAARPCNVGPKPVLDGVGFRKLLVNYIDAITDGDAFELYTYADKNQAGGVDYSALASLHLLIKAMLQVTPTGYLKKQMCVEHSAGRWLSDHFVAYSRSCQRKT